MSEAGPSLFEVPFLAPVPTGNEVYVAALVRSADAHEEIFLVHDRTAGVVYCDDRLLGPLGRDAFATRDPVAALTRFTWRVKRAVEGTAAGAILSTAVNGDHALTRLFVSAPKSPYRG